MIESVEPRYDPVKKNKIDKRKGVKPNNQRNDESTAVILNYDQDHGSLNPNRPT